jgi:hypothetical protein
MAIVNSNSSIERLFGQLIIEDKCAAASSSIQDFSTDLLDIQMFLQNIRELDYGVSDFFNQAQSKQGFGRQANLLVDLVNAC